VGVGDILGYRYWVVGSNEEIERYLTKELEVEVEIQRKWRRGNYSGVTPNWQIYQTQVPALIGCKLTAKLSLRKYRGQPL